GLDGEPKSIGGGTYAKSIPNLLAFGPIFPGDEIREHKPDEYISIDNLVKNAQIIAAAMYELAK
ncbi:MAG: dipeptidase PepV, partial [Oscillospiraceae bacterium]|nr:dipeptidase PepV [Oscillospiraceae bacterium]